jgi:hypothetical protein
MINKFVSWTFTALLLFCCASGALGQNVANDPIGNWKNVKSLSVGQKVIVKTKSGEIAKGLISQVTDDSLIVIGKKQTRTLARDNVRQIHTARKSKILGVLGGTVGGVAGFAGAAALIIPIAANGSESVDYLTIPVIIAGTAGGAVVGNRIGNRERKQRLVYQTQ